MDSSPEGERPSDVHNEAPRAQQPQPHHHHHHQQMTGPEVAVFFITGLIGIGIFIASLFGLYELLSRTLFTPLLEYFEAIEATQSFGLLNAKFMTFLVGTYYLFLPGIIFGSTYGRRIWLSLDHRYKQPNAGPEPFLLFLIYQWQFLVIFAAAFGAVFHVLLICGVSLRSRMYVLLQPLVTDHPATILATWLSILLLASPVFPIERICDQHGGWRNAWYHRPGGMLTTWPSVAIFTALALAMWLGHLVVAFISISLQLLIVWLLHAAVPPWVTLAITLPANLLVMMTVKGPVPRQFAWRYYGGLMAVTLMTISLAVYSVDGTKALQALLIPLLQARAPAWLPEYLLKGFALLLAVNIGPLMLIMGTLIGIGRYSSTSINRYLRSWIHPMYIRSLVATLLAFIIFVVMLLIAILVSVSTCRTTTYLLPKIWDQAALALGHVWWVGTTVIVFFAAQVYFGPYQAQAQEPQDSSRSQSSRVKAGSHSSSKEQLDATVFNHSAKDQMAASGTNVMPRTNSNTFQQRVPSAQKSDAPEKPDSALQHPSKAAFQRVDTPRLESSYENDFEIDLPSLKDSLRERGIPLVVLFWLGGCMMGIVLTGQTCAAWQDEGA